MPEGNRLGPYIVFEGLQKVGKSTQLELLVPVVRTKYSGREVVFTREPGGTPLAEAIRVLAQGMKYDNEMEYVCEAYLYSASRAQSLRRIVRPAQVRGAIVIADRSYYSSVAIQGGARGLDVERVMRINQEAVDDIRPHRVFLLDEKPEECVRRAAISSDRGDKFEIKDLEFYTKVREGYLEAAKLSDGTIEIVDVSGQSIEAVHGVLVTATLKFLEEYFT